MFGSEIKNCGRQFKIYKQSSKAGSCKLSMSMKPYILIPKNCLIWDHFWTQYITFHAHTKFPGVQHGLIYIAIAHSYSTDRQMDSCKRLTLVISLLPVNAMQQSCQRVSFVKKTELLDSLSRPSSLRAVVAQKISWHFLNKRHFLLNLIIVVHYPYTYTAYTYLQTDWTVRMSPFL